MHLGVMLALYGAQWETELQSKEGGVNATGSKPLVGEGPTCASPSGGSAQGHTTGSPRRGEDDKDILQDKDPWKGQRLPGSAPNSPPQTRRSPGPSASSGSRPSIPPGLGEPRSDDYHVRTPVPGDSPVTPRGREGVEEDEVKLRSPQPVRSPSAADTPEQSAKSEASMLSTDDNPETIIQLCHAEYDPAWGTVEQHVRRLMKNSERLGFRQRQGGPAHGHQEETAAGWSPAQWVDRPGQWGSSSWTSGATEWPTPAQFRWATSSSQGWHQT